MKKVIIGFALVLSGLPALAHPFHVTVIEIERNVLTHSFEISMKILSHDLEKGLENYYGDDHLIGGKNTLARADSLIRTYVGKQFALSSYGKDLNLQWVGKEAGVNVTWCYWQLADARDIKTLEVWCPLLTGVYPPQTNVVNYFDGDRKQSMRLNKDHTKGTIKVR